MQGAAPKEDTRGLIQRVTDLENQLKGYKELLTVDQDKCTVTVKGNVVVRHATDAKSNDPRYVRIGVSYDRQGGADILWFGRNINGGFLLTTGDQRPNVHDGEWRVLIGADDSNLNQGQILLGGSDSKNEKPPKRFSPE